MAWEVFGFKKKHGVLEEGAGREMRFFSGLKKRSEMKLDDDDAWLRWTF